VTREVPGASSWENILQAHLVLLLVTRDNLNAVPIHAVDGALINISLSGDALPAGVEASTSASPGGQAGNASE
jgi:hypothetical protein